MIGAVKQPKFRRSGPIPEALPTKAARLEPQFQNTTNLKCRHKVGILGLARPER